MVPINPPRTTHMWGVVLLTLLLITLSFLPLTQKSSDAYVDANLERALTSFAIAKGLNAVISVAQGTQIAATPAGVGVNIAAGELLDPLNDMIERFSWVMLASTVSLGLQKLLLNVTGTYLLQGALLLFGALGIIALIRGKQLWTVRLFLILIVLRFSMPLIALSNELFFQSFQKDTYTQATLRLQETHSSHELLTTQEEGEGFFNSMKKLYSNTAQAFNVKQHLLDMQNELEQSFTSLIDLMVLFIVQTVLLPLVFLYFVVLGVKKSWSLSFHDINNYLR